MLPVLLLICVYIDGDITCYVLSRKQNRKADKMTWTYNVITLQGILDFFIVKSNNFNNKIDRDVGADRSKATDKMVCQQTSKGRAPL